MKINNTIMKTNKILFLAVLLMSISCTSLDEGIYDKQVADNFYATPEGINATLANIYNEIRGDFSDGTVARGVAGADRGWFDLNETSTDELMIPIRTDGAWNDNGIWVQMYQHKWTPAHEFMRNTWNWLYRAVFKANLAVDLLVKAKADAASIGEAKVLRAYFYYMLMDGWGKVPFYTDNNLTTDKIPQAERQVIFDFVVKELTENVPNLVETIDGTFYGRFNKWAGYTLLAKVYINAQVYTGTPKWTEATAACDQVINSTKFSLVPSSEYFSKLFGVRCDTREVILPIYINANSAPRNIIGIRTLKGAQGDALFGFSTWNGATVHKDFVNKYPSGDNRSSQWITGSQAGGVVYDIEIASITSADVSAGARNTKFFPVAPYNGGAASNHFPIYRYADVLLMKAEALVRNSSAAAAKTLVDQVRVRSGAAALSANPTLDDIYDERGRELCWEGHRRQDMIRFDRFTQAHDFKPASAATYKLFPIPTTALATNTSLQQNPGYN
jgi:starch-binding outer membrane protein, SusD/RagB family